MNLAYKLARARFGQTGINPSVGCVIVKGDEILSIGQTGFNGRPHAETNAINGSLQKVNGAKMYITLEPCNHYGKTPPCTNLIIKKKIKEVFYSINDIDKKVSGKSFKILKSKKISVKKGLLASEVSKFYESYFYNRKHRLPYVTGKLAISKNNLIYSKGVKRITDIQSDKLTHYLRYQNDSILISYKTLNCDNPRLDCRINGLSKYSPIKIILDNKLQSKVNSYLFRKIKNKNIIIFYNKADSSKIRLFKKKKINLIKSNLLKDGNFDLNKILKKLYSIGCRNLLVEGGSELSKSFFKNKLFNKFYLFKSPKKLSEFVSHKSFKSFYYLSQNYKSNAKIINNNGKDKIFMYQN